MYQDPETLLIVVRQRQTELREEGRQTPEIRGRDRIVRWVRKPRAG